MEPELKAKWVAALRSGKYQQTTGQLRNEKGFCCLGVLLDVWGRGEWLGELYSYETGDIEGEIQCSGDLDGLAKIVLSENRDEEGRLIALNDGDEKNGKASQPFPVIADYIEAKL